MLTRIRRLSRLLLLVGFVLVLSPDRLLASCVDNDGDGYPGPLHCGSGTDCNDSDTTVHPGARELCDRKDNDCNGQVDEGPFMCGVGDCRHSLQCVNGILPIWGTV